MQAWTLSIKPTFLNEWMALPAKEVAQIQKKLLQYGKQTEYVLLPSDVRTLWASNRIKDELVKFFQALYKPASQYEQE